VTFQPNQRHNTQGGTDGVPVEPQQLVPGSDAGARPGIAPAPHLPPAPDGPARAPLCVRLLVDLTTPAVAAAAPAATAPRTATPASTGRVTRSTPAPVPHAHTDGPAGAPTPSRNAPERTASTTPTRTPTVNHTLAGFPTGQPAGTPRPTRDDPDAAPTVGANAVAGAYDDRLPGGTPGGRLDGGGRPRGAQIRVPVRETGVPPRFRRSAARSAAAAGGRQATASCHVRGRAGGRSARTLTHETGGTWSCRPTTTRWDQ
jgi:hypothetical protein